MTEILENKFEKENRIIMIKLQNEELSEIFASSEGKIIKYNTTYPATKIDYDNLVKEIKKR